MKSSEIKGIQLHITGLKAQMDIIYFSSHKNAQASDSHRARAVAT
jgi:hypothetical protein